MKRVFAFFVAVVLILPLCGCSQRPLTTEEYHDELRKCSKVYIAESLQLAEILKETGHTEKDVDREAADVKAALDKFRELNPPEKYSQQHEKLCQSLGAELRFQQAVEQMCRYSVKGAENLSAEETAEVVKLGAEMEKMVEVNEFGSAYFDLLKTVKADVMAEQRTEVEDYFDD